MYYDIDMVRNLLANKPTRLEFLEEVHMQISESGYPNKMVIHVSKGKYSHHTKKQVIQLLGYRITDKKPKDTFEIYIFKG